ncbi:AsmA-like C-terminal region-containing protein [Desulfovibrio sp. ZJ369]|uniref:AsmA-like C-terminal region-containing protein n=1 Tax=Desulfovibrio sp. ZJ369 TaxID=2709793 RepID=UPI0013EAF228|nr:AsmA-like C-terminal region-containing protein [Desulfovibrio sp. ZJ369]
MLLTARRLRFLARIFLALILSLSALLGVAVYLLQRNPEALTRRFLDELSQRTGLTFSVEAVDVVIFPMPSIAISNGTVEGPDLHFSVAYATLRPDFPALLRGELAPRNISLLRPRLRGGIALPLGDPQALLAHLRKGGGKLPTLPDDCRLTIVQGEADLTASDRSRLQLTNLQCRLDTDAPAGIKGRLHLGTALLQPVDAPPLRLANVLAEGKTSLADPLTATPHLKAGGALRLPGRLDRLDFSLQLQGGTGGWTAETALRGEVSKDQALLPFFLEGTAAMRNSRDRIINLEQIRLGLGHDSGQLSAVLRLGDPGAEQAATGGESTLADKEDSKGQDQSRGFALDGRLLLHRVSLTQWLGFARNLAPGLQLALDNITDGSLDFHLDGQGLVVPRIVAHCAGSRFTGSGGVPSWKKPEVVLDLSTRRINLGLAIPEAVGKAPDHPWFPHATLTPMPGGPREPGAVGVDYNIRLGAQTVDYGPLLLNEAEVVIRQGKMDKNGLEDTLLFINGRLYNGTVSGETILGGGSQSPYAIKVNFRDVEGAPLAAALDVLPLTRGRLRADVEIMSQGQTLTEFLDKLRGSATVRADQGVLRLSRSGAGGVARFKSLEAGLRLRGGTWDKQGLGLNGQWQGRFEGEGLDARADLDGMIRFSGDGGGNGNLDFQNLPGSLSLQMSPDRSSLPQGLHADLAGEFSCRGARNMLSVSNAHGNALGIEARGQAQLVNGKGGMAWQGNLFAQSADLGRTLRLARGLNFKLPSGLRAMRLEADFKGDANELALSGIRARLDQSSISGSFFASWREQLSLAFQLTVDALDLDRYLDAPGHAAKQASPAVASAPGKRWDLRFLREFNAEGELRIKLLTAWRFRLQEARFPIKLENGRLTCAPVTGRFYGAPLQSRGSIDFNNGLRFANSLSVENFDLGAASRDRGGSAALGGRAGLSSEMRASLTGPGQLPAALDGKWRFMVRNGSYQQRGPDGRLKGKPTLFRTAGASGVVTAGIARSSDFDLQGPGLKVHGGGWINLNTDTLDCTFTVNMKNLPDFPLRLYGSLDNSKTSIGTGKLILNTLGGITQGFVDVLGGIVRGTWRLFR